MAAVVIVCADGSAAAAARVAEAHASLVARLPRTAVIAVAAGDTRKAARTPAAPFPWAAVARLQPSVTVTVGRAAGGWTVWVALLERRLRLCAPQHSAVDVLWLGEPDMHGTSGAHAAGLGGSNGIAQREDESPAQEGTRASAATPDDGMTPAQPECVGPVPPSTAALYAALQAWRTRQPLLRVTAIGSGAAGLAARALGGTTVMSLDEWSPLQGVPLLFSLQEGIAALVAVADSDVSVSASASTSGSASTSTSTPVSVSVSTSAAATGGAAVASAMAETGSRRASTATASAAAATWTAAPPRLLVPLRCLMCSEVPLHLLTGRVGVLHPPHGSTSAAATAWHARHAALAAAVGCDDLDRKRTGVWE